MDERYNTNYRKERRLKYQNNNKTKKEYFKNNIVPKLRQKLKEEDDQDNHIRISLVDNQYNMDTAQQKRNKKTPAA